MRRSTSCLTPLAVSGGALIALAAVHCASATDAPPAQGITSSSAPESAPHPKPSSDVGATAASSSASQASGSSAQQSPPLDAESETDSGFLMDSGATGPTGTAFDTKDAALSADSGSEPADPSSSTVAATTLTASSSAGSAVSAQGSSSSGLTTAASGSVTFGSSATGTVPTSLPSALVTASVSVAPQPSSSALPPTTLRAWQCPSGVTYSGSPIPNAATPLRVAGALPDDEAFIPSGWGNVEGPVWAEGSLYFTEMKNGNLPTARILKLTPGTPNLISVWLTNAGANGLALDNGGDLISANHKTRGVTRLALAGGASSTLIASYQGTPFNSPNDVTVQSDGTIYFSDPTWQNSAGQLSTRVYRLKPSATEAEVVTDYSNQPNGVTLSLDEKTLFVSGQSGVKAYAIADNGNVAQQGSAFGGSDGARATDGMTIDCAGNLYVAVNGSVSIMVLGPDGEQVAGSPVTLTGANLPSAVTNLAFGGSDRKTLYITAQGNNGRRGLFEVKLNFAGAPY
jgi:gluconolactonase